MIFYTGWSRGQIEVLEIAEIIEYLNHLRRIDAERHLEFLRGFAAYNLESTRLAFSGSKNECEKYLRKLQKKESVEENDIDEQFKGVKFVE